MGLEFLFLREKAYIGETKFIFYGLAESSMKNTLLKNDRFTFTELREMG